MGVTQKYELRVSFKSQQYVNATSIWMTYINALSGHTKNHANKNNSNQNQNAIHCESSIIYKENDKLLRPLQC